MFTALPPPRPLLVICSCPDLPPPPPAQVYSGESLDEDALHYAKRETVYHLQDDPKTEVDRPAMMTAYK